MQFKSETLNFRLLVTLIQQGYAKESMLPIHSIKYSWGMQSVRRRAYKSGTFFNCQTVYSKYCKQQYLSEIKNEPTLKERVFLKDSKNDNSRSTRPSPSCTNWVCLNKRAYPWEQSNTLVEAIDQVRAPL